MPSLVGCTSSALRTYGRWHAWDGKPLAKKPLFYQGVDNETADVLTGISDDIQKSLEVNQQKERTCEVSRVRALLRRLAGANRTKCPLFFRPVGSGIAPGY